MNANERTAYEAWREARAPYRDGTAKMNDFLDGLRAAGPSWLTISPADREQHAQECRWGCVFDEAHRAFGACGDCGGDTEAVGPDELSRCCNYRTVLTPEEAHA